jgi:1,4-dihydroxy-2-naphthoyl-CoA hydrolase
MTIWFDKNVSLESLKAFGKGTMTEHLGVEWVELGKDFFKAKMPVDHRQYNHMVYCMVVHPVF